MTNTCENVGPLLGARHDGALDAPRARAVDAHVARCGRCRAELDELARLGRVAAALPEAPPDPDLAARVRAAAEAGEATSPWAFRVAAAAAVVMVSATAYSIGLWQGGRAPAELAREDGDATGGLTRVAPVTEPREAAVHEERSPADDPGAGSAMAALPSDDEALRAARSLFADLALVDQVPEPVRAPMLEAQLMHFGLDRWARARVAARRPGEDPLGEVVDLVLQLEDAVDAGARPEQLAVLRDSAAEPGLWRVPPVEQRARRTDERDVDALFDRMGVDLEGETRRSLGRWIVAKDAWVRRGDDLDPLVQIVGQLGAHLEGPEEVGAVFTFPDLGDIEAELEWEVGPDGSRRGVLHRESEGPDGRRELHIEVRTHEFRIGG